MATKKQSKTPTTRKPSAAKPVSKKADDAAKHDAAARHTRENVILDSVIAELMARGQKLNVADIAASVEKREPTAFAKAAAERLSVLAEASGNSELAMTPSRVNGHLAYCAVQRGALSVVDGVRTWKPRSDRNEAAATSAKTAYAKAVAAAAKKRKR